MKYPTLSTRRGVAVLALAVAAFTSPLVASETSDCYDDVITLCDDAMEDARWYERIALGIFCSGMLAGCGVEAITLSF